MRQTASHCNEKSDREGPNDPERIFDSQIKQCDDNAGIHDVDDECPPFFDFVQCKLAPPALRTEAENSPAILYTFYTILLKDTINNRKF